MAPAHTGSAAVEREVGDIAAVLENRLAYEERVLVSVLDHLRVDAGSPDDGSLRAPLRGIFDADGRNATQA